jgi:DNA polymerase III delta prime subunit
LDESLPKTTYRIQGVNMLLTNKYEPKSIDDIKLNDKNLDEIIKWCNGWLSGGTIPTKPALLLHGSPGIGKTTVVKCITNDCEWDLIELNASDVRTKEQLQNFCPEESLSGNKTCILFDEIDSLEKGGETILRNLISLKQFPIIVTANDQYKISKELKDLCEIIQIYRPSVNVLKTYLLEICNKEGLNPAKDLIEAASLSQDYRLAINMIDNNHICDRPLRKLSLRENALCLLYNEPSSFKDTKSLIFWINENAPKLYSTWNLYKIQEILFRVDQLNKRKKFEWANDLLKTIPKTMMEEFELNNPPKYTYSRTKE